MLFPYSDVLLSWTWFRQHLSRMRVDCLIFEYLKFLEIEDLFYPNKKLTLKSLVSTKR